MTQYNTSELRAGLKHMSTPDVYKMFKDKLDHAFVRYEEWKGITHVLGESSIPDGFTPLARFEDPQSVNIVCGKLLTPSWLIHEVPR